jgi:hypothetical protein
MLPLVQVCTKPDEGYRERGLGPNGSLTSLTGYHVEIVLVARKDRFDGCLRCWLWCAPQAYFEVQYSPFLQRLAYAEEVEANHRDKFNGVE